MPCPLLFKRFIALVFISPATLFVKAMATIDLGSTPISPTRYASRYVRTRVLPLPAPATTRAYWALLVTALY